jgi:replicative DNA helicase
MLSPEGDPMFEPASAPVHDRRQPSTETQLARLNRSMPANDEAERGVLSGILTDPARRLPECAAKLQAEMFYSRGNRLVYELLVDFMQRDTPVNPGTLIAALRQREQLDMVGGAAALSELFGFIPVNAQFDFDKKQLIDKWLLRRLIAACTEGIALAMDHGSEHLDEEAMQALTVAEEKVFSVLQLSMDVLDSGLGPVPSREFMHGYVEHLEKVMQNVGKVIGLHTGIVDLDRIICGLDDARGELLVIGARPGHGKTALLGTFLVNMTLQFQLPTLMFSMEMSTDQLMDRVVFGGFGISTSKARTGMLSSAEQGAVMANIRKVQGSPLWIDESGELNTVEFRARVDMMVRQHGIKLLIIDYLQLLEPCTKIGKSEERLAITEALKVIHALKKKHKLVILCAAQLNQNIEKTPGRRHVLSDFAGSDGIGKYADYALFIVRPAEVKRWKDLQEKPKLKVIEQWARARFSAPEMWSGSRIKEASEHPLDKKTGGEKEGGEKEGRDELDFDDQPHRHKKGAGKKDPSDKVKPSSDEANEDGRTLATTVMVVHDGTTWLFDNEKDWDESAELQLVKNRNGPTPDVPVRFRREFARFEGRTSKLFSNNPGQRQFNV